MKYTNISKDELILLAEDSFKKKNYNKCYSVCSELLKQKAPSVVVYMHSICSLNIARKNDEYLDRQTDNTLLVMTALNKFYTNSVVKNEKINFYVLDILQTLLLLNVDCAIYTIKSKKQLRSKKRLENSLLLSKQNLNTLKSFNFESFALTFPSSIIKLKDLAMDQILEFIDLSISGSWQAVDEYRLKLTDTYEQIASFGKAIITIGVDGVLQKEQEEYEYELERKEREKYSSQQVIEYDEQGDDVDDYYIYDSLKEKNKKNIITKDEDDIDIEGSSNSNDDSNDDPLDSLKQDLGIFDDLKQESKEFIPPQNDPDINKTLSEIEQLESELNDIQHSIDEKNQQQDVEDNNEDTYVEASEDMTYAEKTSEKKASNDSLIEASEFELDDSDVEISVSDELSYEEKQALKKKKTLMVDISIVVVSTIITLLILTLIMMQFKPDFIEWLIDAVFK